MQTALIDYPPITRASFQARWDLPQAARDRRLARTVGGAASLADELEARFSRDAWIYEREDIAALTASAAGTPDGNVLVVRAHVRQGTEPIVASALADLRLYDRWDSYRGSSDDQVFMSSLRLVSELVHVIRPAGTLGRDGQPMMNENVHTYENGVKTTWHRGEYLQIEKLSQHTVVSWSTDLSLRALTNRLQNLHAIAADVAVEFSVFDEHRHPWIDRVESWEAFRGLVDNGLETQINNVSIPVADAEVYWQTPNPAERSRYSKMALAYSTKEAEKLVGDYVEATGTPDVRSKGPTALKAFKNA